MRILAVCLILLTFQSCAKPGSIPSDAPAQAPAVREEVPSETQVLRNYVCYSFGRYCDSPVKETLTACGYSFEMGSESVLVTHLLDGKQAVFTNGPWTLPNGCSVSIQNRVAQ